MRVKMEVLLELGNVVIGGPQEETHYHLQVGFFRTRAASM
ncbi:hypothetical protein TIFTF001_001788 [Ficus carica]|uniref:Uncharacterized protein n=1 Tax=Ficus carica TaxID=3494 RepID=A0AA88CSE3_FICCA|nr:hypothetical protein TIFTF001_001788 [Ficus carica]